MLAARWLVLLACVVCSSNAFRSIMGGRPAVTARSSLSMSKSGLEQTAADFKAKFLPALLGASLLFGLPDNADAARSGGRSGSSSFRMPSAAPSMRSSTALRSSSTGYSNRPIINVSPFGYGYGFSPFGFSPFGFMPINLNVLVLGAVAYAVFTVLSNRAGASDFSNDGTTGSLGSGASVMKLQISMSSDWSQPGNIMETLTRMAERNSAMSGRQDIAKLLSEASMAVLRRQNDWNAAAYEGEFFSEGASGRAEPFFQRLAVQERAKFEEENTSNSVAVIRQSNAAGATKPTQVVVSVVVALRGRSSAYGSNVRSLAEVRNCLQGLAADAITDEGENVMAVEVLWTPSEPGSTISERELIEDYPELIKL